MVLCPQGMHRFIFQAMQTRFQSPAGRLHPAQQELAKSHDGLDDAEHRFDGEFSLGVESPAFLRSHAMSADEGKDRLFLTAFDVVGSAEVVGVGQQAVDGP